MKGWLCTLLASICLANSVIAEEIELTQEPAKQQQCNGMYGKNAWGGSVDPYILIKFDNSTLEGSDSSIVSLVIFEWFDERLLGVPGPSADGEKEIICYKDSVPAGFCNETDIGKFILEPNATRVSKNPVISEAIDLRSAAPIKYPIKKTGYYCVWTHAFENAPTYRAVVEFRNAYGELPAAQIAKLPFYGGLTIVYAVVGAFWAFLYVQNRHDILPVQNYITAILVFLIVEELMTWGFYDYQNRHGNNVLNKVLMIIVAVLNAGRNSFSFFLLLIVCMGYGVVKPSLGRAMLYVRILAGAHFTFGVIYGVASLSITPENAGPLVLLVIMPLAGTLTAFYVWTLNSLNLTRKDLMERKQTVKAGMYQKLWWCLLGSILVIFAFFFLNSFTFASGMDEDFVPDHWQTRWFVLDGWLNLVYLFDIAFVAYLWRPTVNNRRFAMSDELAQDDDGGFEIASFGGSEDEGYDPELASPGPNALKKKTTTNGTAPKSAPNGEAADGGLSFEQPQPHQPGRPSLDGETIFAVGDGDDKWSDDEDEEERKGLTGKNR